MERIRGKRGAGATAAGALRAGAFGADALRVGVAERCLGWLALGAGELVSNDSSSLMIVFSGM